MLNVAFSELKMKKGKVVLTNRGSITYLAKMKSCNLKNLKMKIGLSKANISRKR